MSQDYTQQVVIYGNYNGTLIPIACAADGSIITSNFPENSVSADQTESHTWDASLISLVNNLNRIRNQIVTITGEAWGTVSHSLTAFPHSILTGLANDDHVRYFDKDGSKPLSGASGTILNRIDDTAYLSIRGGSGSNPCAALNFYGKDSVKPGELDLYTMNAAHTNFQAALVIKAGDVPQILFFGSKLENIGNGSAAQDACTYGQLTGRVPLMKTGANSISDGGTITHSLGTTPTTVIAIGSVANEIIAITAKGSTTFTVAIKKRADGSAGTTQTIYWMVC
jgi:hypothetical protein